MAPFPRGYTELVLVPLACLAHSVTLFTGRQKSSCGESGGRTVRRAT